MGGSSDGPGPNVQLDQGFLSGRLKFSLDLPMTPYPLQHARPKDRKMKEYIVPVMLDVTAANREEAGALAVKHLVDSRLSGRIDETGGVDSWWLLHTEDKQHDRNDNDAGRVVFYSQHDVEYEVIAMWSQDNPSFPDTGWHLEDALDVAVMHIATATGKPAADVIKAVAGVTEAEYRASVAKDIAHLGFIEFLFPGGGYVTIRRVVKSTELRH